MLSLIKDKEKRKSIYLLAVILLIGILIRVIGLASYPNSLNADEASSAYDAFSILHDGIDRNGNYLPVFLEAWGSGQNALYSYLMIPLLWLLGLSTFTIRLPMAIIGCISLVVFYCLVKRMTNQKTAIIGALFLAICPWHIMKSRWGLESNLFPDLMLLSIFLLIKGMQDKKKVYQILGYLVAGITAYAYGTSYFFLPCFFIPLLILLVKRKEITYKQAILNIGIIAIIALPIILFVMINTFNLPAVHFPFMTIPRLEVNRYEEVTSLFSSGFVKNSLENFVGGLKILFLQTDDLPWNAIWPYGTLYLFSTAFTIIGIIKAIRKRKEIQYGYIMGLWLIISFLLLFVCEPNINRINIIFFPIIFYTVLGIEEVVKQGKIFAIIVSILYLASFGTFVYAYQKEDANTYSTFEGNLQEPIEYVGSLEDKEIYITNSIKEPYIYVLFYTKYNPYDFVGTVQYYNEGEAFQQVKSFGPYHFAKITRLDDQSQNVYVVKKEQMEEMEKNPEEYGIENLEEKFRVTEFQNYVVLEGIE